LHGPSLKRVPHMTNYTNPLVGWQVDRRTIKTIGTDLRGPESILTEPDGTLWAADARGGVTRIGADGAQRLIALTPQTGAPPGQGRAGPGLPGGLAFDADGNIVIANIGTGAIDLMSRDGRLRTLCDSIGGQALGKTNGVLTDSRGRIWFSVTTRVSPSIRAINEKTADGYVGLIDGGGIRIVAEGFAGAGEIRLDEAEAWLYLVETNGRRIVRLRVGDDGTLGRRETFGPGNLGGTPAGCAFDSAGNLWVALVMTERLIALTPSGAVLTLLDDGIPAAVKAYDEHFYAGIMTDKILAACKGKIAPGMASITFGGPDRKTVFLGSLMGSTIPYFRSPVAGLPLSHWHRGQPAGYAGSR
jgi:gluconolactonase